MSVHPQISDGVRNYVIQESLLVSGTEEAFRVRGETFSNKIEEVLSLWI